MKDKKHMICKPIFFDGEKRVFVFLILAIIAWTALTYADTGDNTEAKTNPDPGVDTDTNMNTNPKTNVNTDISADARKFCGKWEAAKEDHMGRKNSIEFKRDGSYVWNRESVVLFSTETGKWKIRYTHALLYDRIAETTFKEDNRKIKERFPGGSETIFEIKEGHIMSVTSGHGVVRRLEWQKK